MRKVEYMILNIHFPSKQEKMKSFLLQLAEHLKQPICFSELIKLILKVQVEKGHILRAL